ncbi:MAG: cation diffusion facilitator family transporter [Gemmatimonadaceae bacterium]
MSHAGRRFEFPEALREHRTRAGRLCWVTIAFLVAAAFLLALTLGQSEAMKTAWVTDVLSMIPPAAWLVSRRYEQRPATPRFPYGYLRSSSVAFLVTASVLTIMGVWLFADAALKLVRGQRPPIGAMELFGRQLWAGWAMIATLAFSMFGAMILGRMKKKVAETLHDKVLEADAKMNQAEWMSEGAAIVGITLVAFGLWWGDAAAAAFIGAEIIRDGWLNVKQVVGDLMDESPTKMGGRELEELPRKVREAAEALPWVARAGVRLRERGHAVGGDVFVVPRDEDRLLERLDEASERLRALDWRLHGLTVVPVKELDGVEPPKT